MLFDLRSRRRRTAVRVIYAFLALLMLSGLILVGVGTGNNNGGLLNAFTDNGSSNSNSSNAYSAQVKAAIKATKKHPSSPSAWQSLMQARLGEAESGKNYDSTTGVYSKSGKAALQLGVNAWSQYLKVTANKPTSTAALLADRLYSGLDNYSGQASSWQYVIATGSAAETGGAYTCLALTEYAAGDKPLGDLAAAKAVKLTAKLDRLSLKDDLKSSRTSKTSAEEYAVENNC